MNKILTGFILLIASSAHPLQTENEAGQKATTAAAGPTARTASGILRGVTEGDVPMVQ